MPRIFLITGMNADFSLLDEAGLNLHAVLDLDALPSAYVDRLMQAHEPTHACLQVIVIGNAGPALWHALDPACLAGSDPIDQFSIRTVLDWFERTCPGHAHTLVYPSARPVELQLLGERAGWQHTAPFMLGIHPRWGSWFGYRVVLLADTRLAATPAESVDSPCLHCPGQPCIAACPPQAMSNGQFELERCISYRVGQASACASRCLARDACPVGREHRYDDAQVRHCYGHSLQAIRRFLLPTSD